MPYQISPAKVPDCCLELPSFPNFIWERTCRAQLRCPSPNPSILSKEFRRFRYCPPQEFRQNSAASLVPKLHSRTRLSAQPHRCFPFRPSFPNFIWERACRRNFVAAFPFRSFRYSVKIPLQPYSSSSARRHSAPRDKSPALDARINSAKCFDLRQMKFMLQLRQRLRHIQVSTDKSTQTPPESPAASHATAPPAAARSG